jgi:starvation-inducible DNA-binding protein
VSHTDIALPTIDEDTITMLTLLSATRNSHSLPPEAKPLVIDSLNKVLATLLDLKLQVKQAHWNLKEPHFMPLHQLFDTFAAELETQADEVAERAVALGGIASGTAQSIVEVSPLEVWDKSLQKQSVIMTYLIVQYADVAAMVRNSIATVAEVGDEGTADLYTGLSRALDKNLWFLEAHEAME